MDRKIGRVTVLFAENSGKYPHGNSLLVEGTSESMLIDPSLALADRAERPHADRVLVSHCHEDHIAGNFLYPRARWMVHEADAVGLRSLDDMLAIYGYYGDAEAYFRKALVEQFHYTPRADVEGIRDGQVFDLGGVTVRVMHTPGHTRGHCCLWIEPEGVLYLGDIELTSFGPYYGDAWSSLPDFERTLEAMRAAEAKHYATFHHIGVLDGREEYLARLDRFIAVIGRREERLLEFLREPHTIEDVITHRFVYRPGDDVPFADPVEKRSMSQHLERLLAAGHVREVEPGRYLAAAS